MCCECTFGREQGSEFFRAEQCGCITDMILQAGFYATGWGMGELISGLVIRKATRADVPRAAVLINSAYRGEVSRQGWTTEADLLAGKRTDEADLLALLDEPDGTLLLCEQGGELLGTVHLQHTQDVPWLGMLAVRPDRQGQGIGKRLMQYAEGYARIQWRCTRIMMSVVTLRSELIAYYERRGYRRTGELEVFPVNAALWTPKVEGLQMEILEKVLWS